MNRMSPTMFPSDDEDDPDEDQGFQEHILLDKLNRMISGIPPPPSLAVCKMTVSEMMLKINESGFLTEDVTKVFAKQERNPKVFYLNRGDVSEEVANLTQKLQSRLVQNETLSTWSLLCEAARAKTAAARPKGRCNGISPGRRLSHLARRRQMFSRANLQQLSQNEPKAHRIEIKTHTAKDRVQARDYMDSHKGGLPKRALFQSPEEETRAGFKTAPRNAPCRRLFTESSERAVHPPIGGGGYDVSGWLATQNFAESRKRMREEPRSSDRKRRCPRRSLDFSDAASPSQCSEASNNSSNSSSVHVTSLSDSHKKRLLWAVSVALKEKNITLQNSLFRSCATELFNVCKGNLATILTAASTGGTSDKMLKFARQEAAVVVKKMRQKSGVLQDLSKSTLNQQATVGRTSELQGGKENKMATPRKPIRAKLWTSCVKKAKRRQRLKRTRSCEFESFGFFKAKNTDQCYQALKRKRDQLNDSFNASLLENSVILVDATPVKKGPDAIRIFGENTVQETPDKAGSEVTPFKNGPNSRWFCGENSVQETPDKGDADATPLKKGTDSMRFCSENTVQETPDKDGSEASEAVPGSLDDSREEIDPFPALSERVPENIHDGKNGVGPAGSSCGKEENTSAFEISQNISVEVVRIVPDVFSRPESGTHKRDIVPEPCEFVRDPEMMPSDNIVPEPCEFARDAEMIPSDKPLALHIDSPNVFSVRNSIPPFGNLPKSTNFSVAKILDFTTPNDQKGLTENFPSRNENVPVKNDVNDFENEDLFLNHDEGRFCDGTDKSKTEDVENRYIFDDAVEPTASYTDHDQHNEMAEPSTLTNCFIVNNLIKRGPPLFPVDDIAEKAAVTEICMQKRIVDSQYSPPIEQNKPTVCSNDIPPHRTEFVATASKPEIQEETIYDNIVQASSKISSITSPILNGTPSSPKTDLSVGGSDADNIPLRLIPVTTNAEEEISVNQNKAAYGGIISFDILENTVQSPQKQSEACNYFNINTVRPNCHEVSSPEDELPLQLLRNRYSQNIQQSEPFNLYQRADVPAEEIWTAERESDVEEFIIIPGDMQKPLLQQISTEYNVDNTGLYPSNNSEKSPKELVVSRSSSMEDELPLQRLVNSSLDQGTEKYNLSLIIENAPEPDGNMMPTVPKTQQNSKISADSPIEDDFPLTYLTHSVKENIQEVCLAVSLHGDTISYRCIEGDANKTPKEKAKPVTESLTFESPSMEVAQMDQGLTTMRYLTVETDLVSSHTSLAVMVPEDCIQKTNTSHVDVSHTTLTMAVLENCIHEPILSAKTTTSASDVEVDVIKPEDCIQEPTLSASSPTSVSSVEADVISSPTSVAVIMPEDCIQESTVYAPATVSHVAADVNSPPTSVAGIMPEDCIQESTVYAPENVSHLAAEVALSQTSVAVIMPEDCIQESTVYAPATVSHVAADVNSPPTSVAGMMPEDCIQESTVYAPENVSHLAAEVTLSQTSVAVIMPEDYIQKPIVYAPATVSHVAADINSPPTTSVDVIMPEDYIQEPIGSATSTEDELPLNLIKSFARERRIPSLPERKVISAQDIEYSSFNTSLAVVMPENCIQEPIETANSPTTVSNVTSSHTPLTVIMPESYIQEPIVSANSSIEDELPLNLIKSVTKERPVTVTCTENIVEEQDELPLSPIDLSQKSLTLTMPENYIQEPIVSANSSIEDELPLSRIKSGNGTCRIDLSSETRLHSSPTAPVSGILTAETTSDVMLHVLENEKQEEVFTNSMNGDLLISEITPKKQVTTTESDDNVFREVSGTSSKEVLTNSPIEDILPLIQLANSSRKQLKSARKDISLELDTYETLQDTETPEETNSLSAESPEDEVPLIHLSNYARSKISEPDSTISPPGDKIPRSEVTGKAVSSSIPNVPVEVKPESVSSALWVDSKPEKLNNSLENDKSLESLSEENFPLAESTSALEKADSEDYLAVPLQNDSQVGGKCFTPENQLQDSRKSVDSSPEDNLPLAELTLVKDTSDVDLAVPLEGGELAKNESFKLLDEENRLLTEFKISEKGNMRLDVPDAPQKKTVISPNSPVEDDLPLTYLTDSLKKKKLSKDYLEVSLHGDTIFYRCIEEKVTKTPKRSKKAVGKSHKGDVKTPKDLKTPALKAKDARSPENNPKKAELTDSSNTSKNFAIPNVIFNPSRELPALIVPRTPQKNSIISPESPIEDDLPLTYLTNSLRKVKRLAAASEVLLSGDSKSDDSTVEDNLPLLNDSSRRIEALFVTPAKGSSFRISQEKLLPETPLQESAESDEDEDDLPLMNLTNSMKKNKLTTPLHHANPDTLPGTPSKYSQIEITQQEPISATDHLPVIKPRNSLKKHRRHSSTNSLRKRRRRSTTPLSSACRDVVEEELDDEKQRADPTRNPAKNPEIPRITQQESVPTENEPQSSEPTASLKNRRRHTTQFLPALSIGKPTRPLPETTTNCEMQQLVSTKRVTRKIDSHVKPSSIDPGKAPHEPMTSPTSSIEDELPLKSYLEKKTSLGGSYDSGFSSDPLQQKNLPSDILPFSPKTDRNENTQQFSPEKAMPSLEPEVWENQSHSPELEELPNLDSPLAMPLLEPEEDLSQHSHVYTLEYSTAVMSKRNSKTPVQRKHSFSSDDEDTPLQKLAEKMSTSSRRFSQCCQVTPETLNCSDQNYYLFSREKIVNTPKLEADNRSAIDDKKSCLNLTELSIEIPEKDLNHSKGSTDSFSSVEDDENLQKLIANAYECSSPDVCSPSKTASTPSSSCSMSFHPTLLEANSPLTCKSVTSFRSSIEECHANEKLSTNINGSSRVAENRRIDSVDDDTPLHRLRESLLQDQSHRDDVHKNYQDQSMVVNYSRMSFMDNSPVTENEQLLNEEKVNRVIAIPRRNSTFFEKAPTRRGLNFQEETLPLSPFEERVLCEQTLEPEDDSQLGLTDDVSKVYSTISSVEDYIPLKRFKPNDTGDNSTCFSNEDDVPLKFLKQHSSGLPLSLPLERKWCGQTFEQKTTEENFSHSEDEKELNGDVSKMYSTISSVEDYIPSKRFKPNDASGENALLFPHEDDVPLKCLREQHIKVMPSSLPQKTAEQDYFGFHGTTNELSSIYSAPLHRFIENCYAQNNKLTPDEIFRNILFTIFRVNLNDCTIEQSEDKTASLKNCQTKSASTSPKPSKVQTLPHQTQPEKTLNCSPMCDPSLDNDRIDKNTDKLPTTDALSVEIPMGNIEPITSNVSSVSDDWPLQKFVENLSLNNSSDISCTNNGESPSAQSKSTLFKPPDQSKSTLIKPPVNGDLCAAEDQEEPYVDVTGSDETDSEIHTSTPLLSLQKKLKIRKKPKWKLEAGLGLKVKLRLSNEWGVVRNASNDTPVSATTSCDATPSTSADNSYVNTTATSTESYKLEEMQCRLAIERTLKGEPSDYSWSASEEISRLSKGSIDACGSQQNSRFSEKMCLPSQ